MEVTYLNALSSTSHSLTLRATDSQTCNHLTPVSCSLSHINQISGTESLQFQKLKIQPKTVPSASLRLALSVGTS
jgi:hypothetical protein